MCHDDSCSWLRQVCYDFLAIYRRNERPSRDTDHEVLTPGTVAAFPLAVFSPARPQVPVELEVEQRGETPVAEEHATRWTGNSSHAIGV